MYALSVWCISSLCNGSLRYCITSLYPPLVPTYNTHVQLAACLVFNVACVFCKHKVWSVTSLQSVCLVSDQSPSVSEGSTGSTTI